MQSLPAAPLPRIPVGIQHRAYRDFYADLSLLSASDIVTLAEMLLKPPKFSTFRTFRDLDLSGVPAPVLRLYQFLFLYSHSYDHAGQLYEPGDSPGLDAIQQMAQYAKQRSR